MAKFRDYEGLAHHWMYNTDNSEVYGGRMFQKGDSIYSYGYHYKIAEKVRNKKTGEIACVFYNSTGSSQTTSRHKSIVKSAVPSYHKELYVPDCDWKDWQGVLKAFQEEYYDYMGKSSRAVKYKEEYFKDAEQAIRNMKSYLQILDVAGIKYDKRKIGKFWKDLMNGAKEISLEEAIARKEAEETKRINAKKKANREAYNVQLELLRKWKAGEVERVPYLNLIQEAHLRINGDFIETSKSSKVELKEAVILGKMIRAGKDIKGHKIGNFTVIGINKKLELKIGCNIIPNKEVERVLNEIL